MDVSEVGSAMLAAAKNAAGATWPKVQHDFASDLGDVLRNAARIEAGLAVGDIDQTTADSLLRDQSRTLFVLSKEAEVEALVVAQNAINAAIDVLVKAVMTAVKIG